MGNDCSKVIDKEVNQSTIVTIELLQNIMSTIKSNEPIQLTPKHAIKMLELFCLRLQIQLKERIEISVKKCLNLQSNFTLNEFIYFVQNYLPKSK